MRIFALCSRALLASSTLLLFSVAALGQSPGHGSTVSGSGAVSVGTRLSSTQCKEDLDFVEHQLFSVHAYPYTELTRAQFEQVFDSIRATITDSLSATGLFCKIKPVMAYLSDEHADINLPKALVGFGADSVFLPFNLKVVDGKHYVDTVFDHPGSIHPGDEILSIDGIPTSKALTQASAFATGYPSERIQTALRQFGYVYALSVFPRKTFTVQVSPHKTISVAGIPVTAWTDFQHKLWNGAQKGSSRITYTRYADIGYIHANSFVTGNDKDAAALKDTVEAIFKQIHQDAVKKLVIDVSYNTGGNSAVGDWIIAEISDKPYRDYQCDFRRSDEYVKLVQSWGFHPDSSYEALPPGAIQHFDSDTLTPADQPDRFGGKVYVLVGSGTFSSAMMFATIIKDNAIATIVGQTPLFGHPSHFGEMYNTKLPHSQIVLHFGVKHWIRPSGLTGPNVLTPDIALGLDQTASPEQVIKALQ
jgi:C-terminal processing protease CtpA/Prc